MCKCFETQELIAFCTEITSLQVNTNFDSKSALKNQAPKCEIYKFVQISVNCDQKSVLHHF